MGYHLDCGGEFSVPDCRDVDIERAFAGESLPGDGYVILTAPDGSVIQAAGDGDGPYTLEYIDASSDAHVVADGEPNKARVREIFLLYRRGDKRWRDIHEWRPMPAPTEADAAELTACERCGEVAPGRRVWMFHSWLATFPDPAIRRQFICDKCRRRMRAYAVVGFLLLALLTGSLVATTAWLIPSP